MNSAPSPQAMVWTRMRWGLQRHLSAQRVLLALLGQLVMLVFVQHAAGLHWRAGLTAVAIGAALWLAFWPLHQLWAQNDPRWARLVPGHLRTLRHCSWLTVLAVAAALALLVGVKWGLSSTRLLLIAAAVVGTAWLMRRPRLVWTLVLLPPVLLSATAWLVRTFVPLDTGVRSLLSALDEPPALLLGALLCLWALWRWVGDGGAAHWRDHTARLRARRSARRGWTPGEGWGDQLLGRLARAFTWPREWHFERVLRATPVAKLDHLLSRNAHWTVRLWVALLIGVPFGALLWLSQLAAKVPERPVGDNLLGLWIGALSLAFAADVTRRKALWRLRREQAVLALLPGLPPRQGELARALGMRWLAQGLIAWILVLLLVLAYLPHTSPRFGAAMGLALAGCLPLLVAACLLDPARLREPQGPRTGFEGGVLAVCLLAWLLSDAPWPLAASLLAIGLGTLPWALWRWRRLAQAPAPLPVGRLADYSGNSVK